MSTEVDDFLAHYGVPGMKWGKRRAGETAESRKKDNRKTLKKFGKERLAANGGSKKKAIAKSVGKSLALNFVTNSATMAVSSLAPNNPTLRAGVSLAALVIQGVGIGKTVNEIRAVNEASR